MLIIFAVVTHALQLIMSSRKSDSAFLEVKVVRYDYLYTVYVDFSFFCVLFTG